MINLNKTAKFSIGIILFVVGLLFCILCLVFCKVYYLTLSCLLLIPGTSMIIISRMKTSKLVTSELSFYAMLILIAIPFLLALIIILIKNENFWFTDLHKEQWATVYGSFLSYLGTITLGFVTLLQNKNLSDVNKNLMQQDLKLKVYPKEEMQSLALDNKVVKIYFNRDSDFLSYLIFDSFNVFELDNNENTKPNSKMALNELCGKKIMFMKNEIAESNSQTLQNYLLVSALLDDHINAIIENGHEKLMINLQFRSYNCFGVYSEYSGELYMTPQTDGRYGDFLCRFSVYKSLISLMKIDIS